MYLLSLFSFVQISFSSIIINATDHYEKCMKFRCVCILCMQNVICRCNEHKRKYNSYCSPSELYVIIYSKCLKIRKKFMHRTHTHPGMNVNGWRKTEREIASSEMFDTFYTSVLCVYLIFLLWMQAIGRLHLVISNDIYISVIIRIFSRCQYNERRENEKEWKCGMQLSENIKRK